MAYRKEYSLVYHQMVYWCIKVDKADRSENISAIDNGFVVVSILPFTPQCGLCGRLKNWFAIEGIDQHSVGWVAKLVRQL